MADDQWTVVAQTPKPASQPAKPAAAGNDGWTAIKLEPVSPSTPPATSPTAPPPDQPSWRDRVISYLSKPDPQFTPQPGAGAVANTEHVVGNLVKGEFTGDTQINAARRMLGGVAPLILHPLTSAHALIDQLGDAALAGIGPQAYLSHAGLERFRGRGAVTDTLIDAIEQGRANTKETLQGMLDQAKRDPVGFMNEQAGQALVAHGVGEGLGALKDTVAGQVAEHVTAAKKAVLGLSPAEVKEGIVDPKVAENANELQAASQKDAENLRQHMEAVDEVQAANTAKDQAYEARVAAAKGSAEQARAEAAQAAQDAQDTETQRGALARQELELRDRLARRVQQTKSSAKATVDNQFDQVREKVGDASTPLAPLVEAVAEAEDKFKGSAEKVGIFSDINHRALVDGATGDLRNATARSNFGGKSYDQLTPVERTTVDRAVAESEANYQQARGEEPDAEKTIDFDHLRGYSSELGRAINDNIRANGDGDVRQALRVVKERVDAMAQHLANENGAGSKLTTAKKSWASYKSTFEEPTGPSSSGSPVAQAANASDAFHATKPFLSDEPEIAARAKRLLVGDKFGASPHFDEGAGKLVDALRKVKRQQAELPTPAESGRSVTSATKAADTAAGKADEAATTRQAGEKPAPLPEPPPPVTPDLNDLSPEQLQHLKQANLLDKFREFRKLSTYRVSRMINGGLSILGGLVAIGGSVTGMAAGAKLGLELGGGAALAGGLGAFAWSLGPRIFANLMDSPKTIRFLTAPTADELEYVRTKLPASQRTGVEAAIKELSDKAQAAGKLNAPSPWIAILRDLSASTAATANKQGRAKIAADAKAAKAKEVKDQLEYLADPTQSPDYIMEHANDQPPPSQQ